VAAIEQSEGDTIVRWKEGPVSIIRPDVNPRVVGADGRKRQPPSLGEIDPEGLFYIEPHDRLGVIPLDRFPPWQSATLSRVRALAPQVSVHGEIFSPFSQLIEFLGISQVMLALSDDPTKVKACLERLVDGAATLAAALLNASADAVLISSAYAGAGFISRRHYEEFVLPFERRTIERIKASVPRAIVYTHTCGAIGDRLDLMERTGTDGIDTLDPPPLGTVDLAEARRRLSARIFIKGNIDPINTVLRGTPHDCYDAALERLAAAGPNGYILSTACSVPPRAPAENITAISRAAKESACAA
jgi:uroporphyrinogen decarboxylase